MWLLGCPGRDASSVGSRQHMSLLGRLELVPRHANRDEVRHQRAPDGSGRAADEGTREPEPTRTTERVTGDSASGSPSQGSCDCMT
jgi:hypothetical protein